MIIFITRLPTSYSSPNAGDYLPLLFKAAATFSISHPRQEQRATPRDFELTQHATRSILRRSLFDFPVRKAKAGEWLSLYILYVPLHVATIDLFTLICGPESKSSCAWVG